MFIIKHINLQTQKKTYLRRCIVILTTMITMCCQRPLRPWSNHPQQQQSGPQPQRKSSFGEWRLKKPTHEKELNRNNFKNLIKLLDVQEEKASTYLINKVFLLGSKLEQYSYTFFKLVHYYWNYSLVLNPIPVSYSITYSHMTLLFNDFLLV